MKMDCRSVCYWFDCGQFDRVTHFKREVWISSLWMAVSVGR